MFKSRLNLPVLIISFCALLVLTLAYSNHFQNGFHFDDTHTINNNEYIRDIGNIPSFFTDLSTFGTMPHNRSYRPVVTTLNAIDFWLGGELKPFYFHLSIFLWYIVQAFIFFFFFKNLLKAEVDKTREITYISLLSVIFYTLHTANAETINYIIMRSDSFSTLCIMASLLIYQWPKGRKYKLYLITMLIGIATKEVALMFVPLLFFYVLFFEEKTSLFDLVLLKKPKSVLNSLKAIFPSLFVGLAFFMFSRAYFRPEASLFFTDHPSSPLYYFMTQWYVIVHYIGNFILPLDLSADPDFQIIKSPLDQRILFSLALLLIFVVIAFISSKNKKPIAFGILWFFITLAPTSSIKPFGQISNDHRTFLPYIGLTIALAYFLFDLWKKNHETIKTVNIYRIGLPVLYTTIILLHAFGVYQRNKVWENEETLWADVAVKSPNNGRGLMNYGLSKMQKGDYAGTLDLFERALKLMPYYSYLHINMGILKNAMGFPVESETYFKNAIAYDRLNVEAYYYYANWLIQQNRSEEARALLTAGNQLSPGHTKTIALLTSLNQSENQLDKLKSELQLHPSAEGYLNLSLSYYKIGKYLECIAACNKALEINPAYAEAYNNICSSYILLNEPDKAKIACQKALDINPSYDLAKNNLKWAENIKAKMN